MIFFLKFTVYPCKNNTHSVQSEGAYAACWINASDSTNAFIKAKYLIERDEWTIETLEIDPFPISRDMIQKSDFHVKNYDLAFNDGHSIYYFAWSKNVEKETELVLRTRNKLNKKKFYSGRSSVLRKGYCLHPDSESCCNQIIKAHSIQKNQVLSAIAVDSHVYQLSRSSLSSKLSAVQYQKEGINKASVFRGFCKKHDNELFEEIDNNILFPSEHQVFLYAYRSICKEVFEKNKALNILNEAISALEPDCAEWKIINSSLQGTKYGLDNLIRIKSIYDNTLINKTYNDMKFVIFKYSSKPNMAFSGLIYPDFDFMGNQLQDLADTQAQLSLVTACSAPMSNGWGYLIAWHTEGGAVGDTFIQSLAEVINSSQCVEDALFRFIISSCENHAFSPLWWESINSYHQEAITQRVGEMIEPMAPVPNDYLRYGLEGIVDWSFEEVFTNLEPYT